MNRGAYDYSSFQSGHETHSTRFRRRSARPAARLDALLGAAFAVLAVASAWRIAAATRDPVHPLAAFTLVWLGFFGLSHFRFSERYDEPYYGDPFNGWTYVVVVVAYLAFAAGFVLSSGRRPAPLRREALSVRLRQVAESPKLTPAALAVFAVATLATAWFVRVAGTIPLFSPEVNTLRRSFQLPLLGYLYQLHILAALLFAMLFLRERGVFRRTAWLTLTAASVVMLMFNGVRVSAMVALAWIAVYGAYARPRVSRRAAMIVAAAGLTIFVAVEAGRRRQFRDRPELRNPRVDTSAAATIWAHTGASFKNLQFTLAEIDSPLNMGLSSYDLPKTFFPETRKVDDQLYVYGTHNTPTFLGFLYLDFGLAGLVVMPLAYGALVAFVYDRFRRRANLFWLVLYIDAFLAVLLSFRTHRFLGNNLIFFGGAAVALHLYLTGRTRRSKAVGPT